MARVRDAQKEERWGRLLREQLTSGEPIATFCRRRQVPPERFYWWRRQLRCRKGPGVVQEPPRSASFVPVRLPFVSPTIEVVHPSGCVLRIPAAVDAQSLRNVLDALERGGA
jgi:transposase-like protein